MKKGTTDKNKSQEKSGVKENTTTKEIENTFKNLGLQDNNLAGSSSAAKNVTASSSIKVPAVETVKESAKVAGSSSKASSSLGNAQAWLDSNYPLNGKCQRKGDEENIGKKRSEITKLDINKQNLTGEVKLSGFSNLTKIYCFKNNLTKLDVSNLPNLIELVCFENNLTDLNLTGCSKLAKLICCNNNLTNPNFLTQLKSDKLKWLSIDGNNFKSDLKIFTPFINLDTLTINIDSNSITNDKSQWTGSLEPLHKLTKLRVLDISNTDIESGLEYLPDSLEAFYCSTELKPKSLSQKLIEKLLVHGKPNSENNYIKLLRQWKQVNRQVAQTQQK